MGVELAATRQLRLLWLLWQLSLLGRAAIMRNCKMSESYLGHPTSLAAASASPMVLLEALAHGTLLKPEDVRATAAAYFADTDHASKSTLMLRAVEHLQPLLTDPNDRTREHGMHFLAELLSVCVASLAPDQASFLAEFLTGKLSQGCGLEHVCRGLLILLRTFPSKTDLLGQAIATIFESVDVQRHPQATRFGVFEILHHIATCRLPEIDPVDFVRGFLKVMDGEKDPRNLMIAFRTVYMLASSCNQGIPLETAEDLFDTIFCYFPITFRPPPDDPYGITAEELKVALAAALTAAPEFAQHALPALLGKLESASPNARRDALTVLHDAACNFPASSLQPHTQRLWGALRNEILQSADQNHETLALRVFAILLKILPSGRENSAGVILSSALSECRKHLITTPDTKHAQATAHLLETCARACPEAGVALVPSLLDSLAAASGNGRRTIADALLRIAESTGACTAPFAKPLYSAFWSLACARGETPPVETIGFRGLFALIEAGESVVAVSERPVLVEHFTTSLLEITASSSVSDELQRVITRILHQLVKKYPQTLGQQILNSLLTPNVFFHEAAMNALESLATAGGFAEIILDRIFFSDDADDKSMVTRVLEFLLRIFTVAPELHASRLVTFFEHARKYWLYSGSLHCNVVARIAAQGISKLPSTEQEKDVLQSLFKTNFDNDPQGYTVFAAAIANVSPDTLDHDVEVAVLHRAIGLAEDPVCGAYAAQLAAAIVNKSNQTDCIMREANLDMLLLPDMAPTTNIVFSWLIKGLLMRAHPTGFKGLDRQLDLLRSPALRPAAARALAIVLDDTLWVLPHPRRAVVLRPLYKQRVFHHCLPKIVALLANSPGSDVSPDGRDDSCMRVLCLLLESVPTQVLAGSFASVLQIVLRELSSDNTGVDVVRSLLKALNAIIDEAPAKVAAESGRVIPALLKQTDPGIRPMEIRIAALRCVATMARIRKEGSSVASLQKKVIQTLTKALDDPKRLVRREAVNARTAWLVPLR